MPFTCTKTFDCISTAHRNHRAAENPNRDSKKCSYIHGYTKTFTFVFGCNNLDDYNWVYDYGTTSSNEKRTMTLIKEFITETLDHAVTTDDQDPLLSKLYEMQDLGLLKLVVIPTGNGQSGSVEGLCRTLFNMFNPLLEKETNSRVWIESVTVSEHQKNSSTYTNPKKYSDDVLNSPSEELREKLSDEDAERTRKAFEEFEKKNEQSNIINNILTKENIEAVTTLLSLHPKAKAIGGAIQIGEQIQDLVKKNPDFLKNLIGKK